MALGDMKKTYIFFQAVRILVLTFVLSVITTEAIKITEERAGKNQRYVSMTELEKKSAFYLRKYRRIGDEEEVKEKVKIMCDRLQELYREHGLDAIHDLFETVDNLEVTIGGEEKWQNFISELEFASPAPSRLDNQILAVFASTFIIAVVTATPFSYKHVKRFVKGANYNKVDAEWKGAELVPGVLVRRMKRRTRRKLYRPALPNYDLTTEQPTITGEKLEEVKKVLEQRQKRNDRRAAKLKKQWETNVEKIRRDMDRRRKILEDSDEDNCSQIAHGRPAERKLVDTTRRRKPRTIINMKSMRKCWNGQINLKRSRHNQMRI